MGEVAENPIKSRHNLNTLTIMKKYLLLFAVAVMSIACGGNNAEKKEGEVKLTVEQQAKDYQKQTEDLLKQTMKAIEAGDEKKVDKLMFEGEKLTKEYEEWYKGLSEEDKAKADEAMRF